MLTPSQERILRGVRLTELQAIAIYEAEIFVLQATSWSTPRRRTLELCRAILIEERQHLDSTAMDSESWLVIRALARGSGWIVGVLLSLVPTPWSWRLHARAEIEAARTYENALPAFSEALAQSLRAAAQQERDHSRRFAELAAQGRGPA